jgi:plastocyanin
MVFAAFSIMIFALSACGGTSASSTPTSVATVNIKETKGAGPGDTGDVYTFDPATISIHKGDTVTFTNLSDQTQDTDQGDTKAAGVDFVMAINQSVSVTFNITGTFTLKTEKGASITVTVA